MEASDPRLEPYRRLKQSADSDGFIVEGKLLVERLADSPLAIQSVVVDASRSSLLPSLPDTVPIWRVASEDIRKVVGFDFHRGVLAHALRPEAPPPLEPVGARAVLLAIDRIDDPENLGVILRTCGAFGVDEVVLSPGTVDAWSRRVVRVSMGAVFRLRIRVANLDDEFQRWGRGGVESLVTSLGHDSEPIGAWSPVGPHVWILGREDRGVDPRWIERADRRITIPIVSGIDSLNVAQAAAICLYTSANWRREAAEE